MIVGTTSVLSRALTQALRVAGAGVVVVLLLLPAMSARAQLVVNDSIPLEELVRKHFIGGGANVTNITGRGFPRSRGFFDGRNTNLGISEGIMLTSGWVGYAPGPNRWDDVGFAAFTGGDADLAMQISALTFDACVIEFDFVPYQDTVSFEYVFASEEYDEYVGSAFNDVFAFFISGPGITGKQNIARLPGTGTPVAINNVNHLTNTAWYVDNYPPPKGPANGGQTIEYDGFTKVLRAVSPVTPCQTYRLKLAISDVMDPILDSGVFLKSGSFNAGDAFDVVAIRDAFENGCQPGLFQVTRGGDISKPIAVTVQLLGDATEGTDYSTVNKTLNFLAGQTSIVVPIDALKDAVSDDYEMVILYIPDFCNTGLIRDTLYIREIPEVVITLTSDTLLCEGSQLLLRPGLRGGGGPFSFDWTPPGSTDTVLTLDPVIAGVYRFSVYDSLTGCLVTKDVTVRVDSLPVIDAGPDTLLCYGDSLRIGAIAYGGSAPFTYSWSPATWLSATDVAMPVAKPLRDITYVLRVVSAIGCVSYDSISIRIAEVLADAGPDTLVCRGVPVGIGRPASGGTPPYTYEWTPATGLTGSNVATPLALPDTSTTYVLRVTDSNGCEAVDSVRVNVSWVELDAGPDATVCPGETVTIGGIARWTHSPVTYAWTPTTGLDNPSSPRPNARPPRDMMYIVTATNARGCFDRDTVFVRVSDLFTDAGADITMCPGETRQLGATVRGGRAPYVFRWSPTTGLSDATILTPEVSPDTSTWYHLSVIDQSGCVVYDSVRVTVYPAPRIRVAAGGPTTLCTGDSITLEADVQMASYRWNTGATTRSIRVGAAGVYWLDGVTRDGCPVSSDTVTISVVDRPAPVISGPTVLCVGEEAVFATGDFGAALYQWTVTGGFIVDGQGTRSVRVRWDDAGSWSVRVDVVLGSALCRGDTILNVSVLPLPAPVISPGGPLTLCPGDSVVLAAPGGFADYEWSNGEKGERLVVRQAGRYSVTVVTAQGCRGSSPEVLVGMLPTPTPRLLLLTAPQVCEGDSMVVELPGDFASRRWNTGDTTGRLTLRASARVWAEVRSLDGCPGWSDTLDLRILPLPRPVIMADGPLEFCEGDSVRLTTTETYASWLWSNGVIDSFIVVRASGVYNVRVRNAEGCEAEAVALRVVVHPLPPKPVIGEQGSMLRASDAFAWQWFVDDAGVLRAVDGATERELRYEPGVWYRVRVETDFGCWALSDPYRVGRVASSTVGLPELEAAPGDRVIIPLRLLASEYLDEVGVRSYAARISFNHTMLVPVDGTPAGRIENGDRVIDIAADFSSGMQVLSELRFVATLGNAASTPLRIETFAWDNGTVQVTRIDGRFDMPICREGGERLVDGSGTLRLGPNHPNPFNATTIIEYEVIERGNTRMEVLDQLGRRVALLLHAEVEPGAYRVAFDAGALPSGLYWCVLHTPGATLARPLRLLK